MEVMEAKVRMEQSSKRVGIVGTGNFARALCKRLIFSGYDVTMGSRHPDDRSLSETDECLCDVDLSSIAETIREHEVIFVAIHVENFKDTLAPMADLLANKIVIDVSNRDNRSAVMSNSEYLQSLVPRASVVKAFNVVSAYVMENDIAGGSRRIFVAGNDVASRERVCVLARDMGFVPLDLGSIRSARKIEAFVLTLFPGWKVPIFLAFGIFNLWALYAVYLYWIADKTHRWDQVFLKVLNKPLCMTAITMMALTYLPGSLAAVFQLAYGTKHRRFPKLMDRWLKSRKQFGIICFTLVTAHVLMSMMMLSPTYYSSWFQSTAITIPVNLTEELHLPLTSWMIWKGEAACLVGVIAFIALCIIALTTLPSVADSLNWREWQLVQSKLGHMTLLLAMAHVVIMGAPGWVSAGFPKALGSITFLCLILPTFVVLLKLVLSFPCFSAQVKRIRRGWERDGVEARRKARREIIKKVPNQHREKYETLEMRKSCCGCNSAKTTALLPTVNCECSISVV